MTKKSEQRSLQLLLAELSYGQRLQLKTYGAISVTWERIDHVYVLGRMRRFAAMFHCVTIVPDGYQVSSQCIGVGDPHRRVFDRYDEIFSFLMELRIGTSRLLMPRMNFPQGVYLNHTYPYSGPRAVFSKAFFGMEHMQEPMRHQIARCAVCGQFRRVQRKHDHEYRRARADRNRRGLRVPLRDPVA